MIVGRFFGFGGTRTMSKFPGRFALAAILFALAFWVARPAEGAQIGTRAGVTVTRLTTDGKSLAPRGLGWSPTGEYIAYNRFETGGQQLMVRSEDGEITVPVSRVGAPSTAAWSPDGKRMAYVFAENDEDNSEARVYVWSLKTRQSVEVARGFRNHQFGYGTGYGIPVWSPDSRHFVCKIRRVNDPQAYSFAPWVFAADGSSAVQLVPNHYDSGAWHAASWSPDSQWLVFCSQTSQTSGRGLWIARPDGSETRELIVLSGDASVRDPLWSPDGKWIAYGCDEGRSEDERGMHDIWLMRPDGSENHAVTEGSSDTTEGRMHFELYCWSPGSDRLCTVGWRLDGLGVEHGGLYLVEVEAGGLSEIFANRRESSEVITDFEHTFAWDHCGSRIAFCARRHERHGEPGEDEQLTETRDYLAVYDVAARQLVTSIEARPTEDARRISPWGWEIPTWSPDDQTILFTEARVISLADENYEPDLYLLEVGPPARAGPPGAEPQAAVVPAAAAVGGGAVMIVPRNRRASEIAEALPESYRGLYRLDAGMNALVVSAPDEETMEAFTGDVALLDREVPQIMVDVLVTELSRDASRQLGLDWEYVRGSLSAVLPLVGGEDAGQVIYRGVGTFDKSFFATLAALEEHGKADVRANPRVLARCGSQATINIRRTDNFFYDAGTDYQGHPVRARSDISADIILRITPNLLASDRIAMQVDATVDSFIFGGRDELPDTTRRQAVTDVVCADGETIVIGGLTQQEQTIKRQKTPLLGDLPLLGQLFRRTTRSTRESTLVIFITPRVVAQASD
jgi:Tol biopolymer transport system component